MQKYHIRAKELIQGHKKEIIPTLLFIALAAEIPYYFSSVLEIVLAVLTISLGYGSIRVARKVASGRSNEVDTYNDGMSGITNYSRLFSTYFLEFLVPVLYTIGASVIYILFSFMMANSLTEEEINMLSSGLTNEELLTITNTATSKFLVLTVFFVIAVVFIFIHCTLNYRASFYLIDHGYHGAGALKASRKIMKGHKWELVKLYFHYAIPMLGSIVVGGIVYSVVKLLSDGFATVLASVVASLVATILVRCQLCVAEYLFMADLIGEIVEYKQPTENNYYEVPSYEENSLQDVSSRVEFEPISRLKLLIGCITYIPFYLEFASYILSTIFLSIPYFASITDTTVLNSWYNLFYDGILLLIGVIFFFDFFKGMFRRFYEVVKGRFFEFTIKGFAIVYGSNIIASLILSMINSGNSTSANQSGVEEIVTTYPIPMIIAAVLLAPILEELIFRGLIFRFLRNWNKYIAIVVSGFLFGFIHISEEILVYQNYSEFIQIIPYFVMGVVFAIFYEKEKSLAVPIYFHMLNNFVACMFMLIL